MNNPKQILSKDDIDNTGPEEELSATKVNTPVISEIKRGTPVISDEPNCMNMVIK